MFDRMADQLVAGGRARNLHISDSEFGEWQRLAIWDAIRGVSRGRSFCRFFDIYDVFLMVLKNHSVADIDLYIQATYVEKMDKTHI